MPAVAVSGTEPQHLRALERANRVRLARAELKRRIVEGELTAAAVIVDCPWEAGSMAVGDLLRTQRSWGRTRCQKFLIGFRIAENKPLESLTERQRGALAGALRGSLPPGSPRDRAVALVRAG